MNNKSFFIDFEIKGVYNKTKYGTPDPLNPKYFEFVCHTPEAIAYTKEQFDLDCELNKRIHITPEERNKIFENLHNQKTFSLIIS